MSWVGGWLGGVPSSSVSPEPPAPPLLVETPVVHGDPLYVDHVSEAVDRLCQQFKLDPWP